MSAQPNNLYGPGNLADFRDACRRAGNSRSAALEDDVCAALEQVMRDKESVDAIHARYTRADVDYQEIGRIVAQRILLVHARRIQEWMP